MSSPNTLSPLLSALGGLFAAENRPGGMQTAQAYFECASQTQDLPQTPVGPLDTHLIASLANDPHPIAPLIRAAEPWLVWVFSELGGRIRKDVSSGMMQAELIGPDGIFRHDHVRTGLWLQAPDLAYTTRHHPAEETFFILGGHADWQASDTPQHRAGIGAQIFHPSHVPHSDCTTNAPLLAAWRWTGDISIEQYTFKG